MEGIRTFLETSTVHGLSYISTTRKHVRLFWVFVVFSGFWTAGYLIQQSFQTWAESPVKTTVETLPITEITFPKITVCPPRNTYTDLNYDLLSINVSLTEYVDNNSTDSSEVEYDIFGIPTSIESKMTKNDKILDFALDVTKYQTYMDDLMKLEEENRFYNWYHGYTKISQPKYITWSQYEYSIDTSATSGVIKTRHFGERFNDHLSFERNIVFQFLIKIHPPVKMKNNNTLHIKLERVSIKRLAEKIIDDIWIEGSSVVDDDVTMINFKKPKVYKTISCKIRVPKSVDLGRAKKMPGFRVSWWYTGADIVPYRKFADNRYTQDLRR